MMVVNIFSNKQYHTIALGCSISSVIFKPLTPIHWKSLKLTPVYKRHTFMCLYNSFMLFGDGINAFMQLYSLTLGAEVGQSKQNLVWLFFCAIASSRWIMSRHKAALTQLYNCTINCIQRWICFSEGKMPHIYLQRLAIYMAYMPTWFMWIFHCNFLFFCNLMIKS